MKMKTAIAAATLALFGAAANATDVAFVDGLANVASGSITGAKGVSFSQSWTFSGLTSGTYNVEGSLAGNNISFTSVLLNGVAWDLSGTAKAPTVFKFADISYTGTGPWTLVATGTKTTASAGNFSGSLNVTPVPEPETYAMLLAGLGVMGAIARRRNKTAA
ncbi:FxDxF family PEP-CTERM protein [Rhodoferax sp.]|uniref:FxDxF family PEP-CTERM protein n=1 Tax=Rhodoferax sp. TaxID=50421 RepID=UPI0025FF245B|nr:FxDxF family PEP-CTERM protein [Rhodoferax sp.]